MPCFIVGDQYKHQFVSLPESKSLFIHAPHSAPLCCALGAARQLYVTGSITYELVRSVRYLYISGSHRSFGLVQSMLSFEQVLVVQAIPLNPL